MTNCAVVVQLVARFCAKSMNPVEFAFAFIWCRFCAILVFSISCCSSRDISTSCCIRRLSHCVNSNECIGLVFSNNFSYMTKTFALFLSLWIQSVVEINFVHSTVPTPINAFVTSFHNALLCCSQDHWPHFFTDSPFLQFFQISSIILWSRSQHSFHGFVD